jgi:hypothetical protein
MEMPKNKNTHMTPLNSQLSAKQERSRLRHPDFATTYDELVGGWNRWIAVKSDTVTLRSRCVDRSECNAFGLLREEQA